MSNWSKAQEQDLYLCWVESCQAAWKIGMKKSGSRDQLCTYVMMTGESGLIRWTLSLFLPLSSHSRVSSSHELCIDRYLDVFAWVTGWLISCRGDPFANEGDPLANSQDVGSQSHHLHIRIQQRNGRKTLTTLQGLQKGVCVFHDDGDYWLQVLRIQSQEVAPGVQEGRDLVSWDWWG